MTAASDPRPSDADWLHDERRRRRLESALTLAADDAHRRLLERVYEDADGRLGKAVRILGIGREFGWDNDRTMAIASYWWRKGCARAGGGLFMTDGVELTDLGVWLVDWWHSERTRDEKTALAGVTSVFNGPVTGVHTGSGNVQVNQRFVTDNPLADLRTELDRVLADSTLANAKSPLAVAIRDLAAQVRKDLANDVQPDVMAPRASLLREAMIGLAPSIAGGAIVANWGAAVDLLSQLFPR